MTAKLDKMPRYKLIIEYDGAPFFGWQVQETLPSVQGALEAAVKAMTGADARVHGAGRTDAGVHARGQVAHVDIEKQFPPGRFRDGLNAHLRPHPIAVLEAEIVPNTFEARFSCLPMISPLFFGVRMSDSATVTPERVAQWNPASLMRSSAAATSTLG